MKRVRYLAGAAGIAPIAVGALAVGTGPATAAVAGHGKTVSLQTAPRHEAGIRPDISVVPCLQGGFTAVYWAFGFFSECFANGGQINTSLFGFRSLWTGNNGISAIVNYNGKDYYCFDKYKSNFVNYGEFASAHGHALPTSDGTFVHLRIYAGTKGPYGAGGCANGGTG